MASASALALLAAFLPRASAASLLLDSPSPAVQTLNRLTFGATPETVAAYEQLGLERWLDQQLAAPGPDPELEQRLKSAQLLIEHDAGGEGSAKWPHVKENRNLNFLDKPIATLWPLAQDDHPMDYEERIRPAREVQAATILRAVYARAQLREVLTDFWHNHFNVNALTDERTAALFPVYDRMLRQHAFGNFRTLLGEVAKSPPMLVYLNNEASKASPANENYARELFELHTLGARHYYNELYDDWKKVPGAQEGRAIGYIDQDVYEAARAFTGWMIADGRDVGTGETIPNTGEFHYLHAWHDPYQKRLLGVEFRPNQAAMVDGERVLDMVARHPGTADHLCWKLCRRLVADDPPPALVSAAVAEWNKYIEAPDQIARVVRLIALSQDFLKAPPTKLKRPFEYVVSLFRGIGAEVVPGGDLQGTLFAAGWRLHEWPTPTGHPDHASYWANTNTFTQLANLAIYGLNDSSNYVKVNLAAATPQQHGTLGAVAAYWAQRLLGAAPEAAFVQAVCSAVGGEPATALSADNDERLGQAQTIVALVALTPDFLTR